MQQLLLDMGLAASPRLTNFLPGPNGAALSHLMQALATSTSASTSSLNRVPTYLWGPQGSGKSHLLHSVAGALSGLGHRVGHIQADSVGDMAFHPHWQAVLMDDVHAFDERLQQTAFAWFIEAQSLGRWVLAAGRVPVVDLALRDDLRTRLGWGHVFAIQPLSEADQRAVLRQQADERGIFLRDDVMDYVLSRFARNLSALSELLDRLDKFALQNQRAITVPLLRSMLESVP